jgi:L-methionine (R)-S-oxide reductase
MRNWTKIPLHKLLGSDAMTESLSLPINGGKEEIYRAVIPQIASIISGTDDLIANLANVAAVLKQAFDFHWVGFYRTISHDTLLLGPFQGPLACVTIPFGKGVCGAAAIQKETILVPDVENFPGHIACSSLSKSEIVVPLVHKGETKLILDIDSDKIDGSDHIDRSYLEQIVLLIQNQNFTARDP